MKPRYDEAIIIKIIEHLDYGVAVSRIGPRLHVPTYIVEDIASGLIRPDLSKRLANSDTRAKTPLFAHLEIEHKPPKQEDEDDPLKKAREYRW